MANIGLMQLLLISCMSPETKVTHHPSVSLPRLLPLSAGFTGGFRAAINRPVSALSSTHPQSIP